MREQEVYDRLLPPSADRIELAVAQLTALLTNVYAAKGATPARPSDFIPNWWDEPMPADQAHAVQTEAEAQKIAASVTAAINTRKGS